MVWRALVSGLTHGLCGQPEACPEATRRNWPWLTATISILLAASCTDQTALATGRATIISEVQGLAQETTPVAGGRETATITGVRLTEGNAVDCPKIRDDAGVEHPVSYLSPAVAIGTRVSVSGFYAITTSCRGTVLVVEDERILEN